MNSSFLLPYHPTAIFADTLYTGRTVEEEKELLAFTLCANLHKGRRIIHCQGTGSHCSFIPLLQFSTFCTENGIKIIKFAEPLTPSADTTLYKHKMQVMIKLSFSLLGGITQFVNYQRNMCLPPQFTFIVHLFLY